LAAPPGPAATVEEEPSVSVGLKVPMGAAVTEEPEGVVERKGDGGVGCEIDVWKGPFEFWGTEAVKGAGVTLSNEVEVS